MNRVKVITHLEHESQIEREINDFARSHEIIGTSITAYQCGYTTYYAVIVTYKA